MKIIDKSRIELRSGFDGREYLFTVEDNQNRFFRFYISISNTALWSAKFDSLQDDYLIDFFQFQLAEILKDFHPHDYVRDDGSVPLEYEFRTIDSDYCKFGDQSLIRVYQDHGLKKLN
jgi:hypothetical protein